MQKIQKVPSYNPIWTTHICYSFEKRKSASKIIKAQEIKYNCIYTCTHIYFHFHLWNEIVIGFILPWIIARDLLEKSIWVFIIQSAYISTYKYICLVKYALKRSRLGIYQGWEFRQILFSTLSLAPY